MILLTAAAGGSGAYRETGVITTAHLILIAVLAALVVAGLIWGMRQKRLRQAGEEEEAERVEALEAAAPRETKPAERAVPAAAAAATDDAVHTPVPAAPAPPPAGAMGLEQPSASAATGGYQLLDVKGLGPKAVPLLEAQGVSDIPALAALSETRAAEVDAGMGALKGRLARDRWVEQAKLLAAGDRAGFEATFGKL